MAFRITTNMMMNSYRDNLMKSTGRLTTSVDKVLTQRNFLSYSEDPANATQAFRLRRAHWQNVSYISNNDDTYKRYNSAWTTLGAIVTDLEDRTARVSAIRGNNDPTGEGRHALAQVLDETAESVVQSMNVQYGDQFIFAGNDGLNVPFSWNTDQTVLYYRGVNVNAGGVKNPSTTPAPDWGEIDPVTNVPENMPAAGAEGNTALDEAWIAYYTDQANGTAPAAAMPLGSTSPATWGALDEFGVPVNMPAIGGTDLEKAWIAYYNDQGDLARLDKMAAEELNIDLGMGLKENAQYDVINGSAFNAALPGIKMVGYGVDEDGDPKNVSLLMKKLADVFSTWSEDAQAYVPPENREVAYRLMDKLNLAQDATTEQYVELDARAKFLTTNGSRLTDEKDNLEEQILDIEQIDLADAITTLSWDQYCYNAALKIGNQLLSQSLIDYMN